MIKWFAYIVVLLIFATQSLSAKKPIIYPINSAISFSAKENLTDTAKTKKTKKQEQDDKKKIKELAQAKKQPKPEKIEPDDNLTDAKHKQRPKRQRRPEGLERPPEIPRRNGN